MSVDPLKPPLLTADLPGIGGEIKTVPEDFVVEEIPAYEPSGEGDHLFLHIEKRGIASDHLIRLISQRLGIKDHEIGTAGRKDRHAVTRQMISIPDTFESKVPELESDDLKVLSVHRHSNKLKVGHAHGNRFNILIRNADPDTESRLPAIIDRITERGVPNYFGTQRFGHGGETARVGLGLLQGKSLAELCPNNPRKWKHPRQRKFVLSAGQSVLFNTYLGHRLQDGLLHMVIDGDAMSKWPFGGMFVTEDVAAEQTRFDAKEIVPAGPIYGRKTFPVKSTAAEREEAILEAVGINKSVFSEFGKLLMGTRRKNLIFLSDLQATVTEDGVRCTFSLPSGSYATVVLQEIMKTEIMGEED